ncbi:MAG: hypothetical protein H6709_11670 [Kofleriaceae bacterium]|nr:hypothetical protein [Myxococcales bacterium]MCB9562889.1 hypothetical protein [Kofleriaceae bacterium]MCB9572734.1 hypothetical protein [Kofleriaceae bacterium]
MRTTRSSIIVAGLLAASTAACGSSSGGGAHGPSSTPRACPAADAIYSAQYRTADADAYGGNTYGMPATAHWQVALKIWPEEGQWADPPVEAPPELQAGPRTEAEARALLGASDRPISGPVSVWAGAGAPCEGHVVGYYVALTDQGGEPFRVLAADVEGCAPGADHNSWSDWVAFGPVATGCALAPVTEAYSHVATEDWSEDAGQTMTFPDPVAMPATFAAAMPAAACAEPDCHTLYRIRRAGTPTPQAWEVLVTQVTPGEEEDPCSFESTSHQLLLVGDEAGPLTVVRLTEPTMNYETGEPELGEAEGSLSGLLIDGGGSRVLLARHVGAYAAVELGGAAPAASFVPWYVAHEEDGDWFSLAAYCGP